MPENEDRKKIIIEKLMNIKDSTTIKVRVDDTDLMQVVHFKNYLMYFDDGFVSFMSKATEPVSKIVENGIVFPVKKIEIIYENSARFGDQIEITTRVENVGKTSITFLHELYRASDKEFLARVECVRLIMILKTRKLLDITDFFADYV